MSLLHLWLSLPFLWKCLAEFPVLKNVLFNPHILLQYLVSLKGLFQLYSRLLHCSLVLMNLVLSHILRRLVWTYILVSSIPLLQILFREEVIIVVVNYIALVSLRVL